MSPHVPLPSCPRKWLPTLPTSHPPIARPISILQYNVLAQCLIRRKLYPWTSGSALKVKQRFGKLLDEIGLLDADCLTLQEVDRFDDVFQPGLKKLGYDAVYVKKSKLPGPSYLASLQQSTDAKSKLETAETAEGEHGICVAWKRDVLQLVDSKTIQFDSLTGSLTGNVGMMVALRHATGTFIVTNLHLWWRPDGQKRRLEQIVTMLEQVSEWKCSHDGQEWPLVLSGDWNVNADDVLYYLLTKKEQRPDMQQKLCELLGDDHDSLATRIQRWHLVSAYQNYQQLDSEHSPDPAWQDEQGWKGEPSYTTYPRSGEFGWSGTLDYIFFEHDSSVVVDSILQVPPLRFVETGIPNDVFPSDHVPIGIKLYLQSESSCI